MHKLQLKGQTKMKAITPLSLFICCWLLWGCSASQKPATRPSEDNFLSEVRYLISNKEKKLYKKLPPAERAAFIEAFWRIRDPDPTTEENEIKEEYYKRIDEANALFREGSAGWLSDRGRIYILIGEPDRRDVFPSGYSFYEPPVEVWFYGFYTIVFVDYDRENVYRLSTSSAQKLNTINLTQMRFKHEGLQEELNAFSFSLSFKNEKGQNNLLIKAPLNGIALTGSPDKMQYSTQLKVTLTISDDSGRNVVEKNDQIDITVSANEFLKENSHYSFNIPLDLNPGLYRAVLYLENQTDKKKKGQSLTFRIR